MGGDLFDDFGGFGFRGFEEVEAGDLEAVEEEAGAAGVDVVGGDAAENFADGKLNAGTIVGIGKRKVEGGAAAAALLRAGDGFSGGVVVVAEVFSAEAGAAAAVAVGEDVGGIGTVWWLVWRLAWLGSLSREKCAKSSKEKTCVRTSPVQVWFKCEGPALVAGRFLFLLFLF